MFYYEADDEFTSGKFIPAKNAAKDNSTGVTWRESNKNSARKTAPATFNAAGH